MWTGLVLFAGFFGLGLWLDLWTATLPAMPLLLAQWEAAIPGIIGLIFSLFGGGRGGTSTELDPEIKAKLLRQLNLEQGRQEYADPLQRAVIGLAMSLLPTKSKVPLPPIRYPYAQTFNNPNPNSSETNSTYYGGTSNYSSESMGRPPGGFPRPNDGGRWRPHDPGGKDDAGIAASQGLSISSLFGPGLGEDPQQGTVIQTPWGPVILHR